MLRANQQIGKGSDNRVFWEMRYQGFPERGSGVGSRWRQPPLSQRCQLFSTGGYNQRDGTPGLTVGLRFRPSGPDLSV